MWYMWFVWVNVLIGKIELTAYVCLQVEEKDEVVWIEEAGSAINKM